MVPLVINCSIVWQSSGFGTVYDDIDMLEECAALMLGDGTFRHAKGKHNFVSS
jgi:hypothetical protein